MSFEPTSLLTYETLKDKNYTYFRFLAYPVLARKWGNEKSSTGHLGEIKSLVRYVLKTNCDYITRRQLPMMSAIC